MHLNTVPARDAPLDTPAAAQQVARWWRAHGGSWHEPVATRALLAGAAKLAWRCALRDDVPPLPPFAVMLAAWPRCVRILLPDDSRHFGAVIVWLRHFEALLPAGAPPCHLVLAPRPGDTVAARDGTWLWGRDGDADAMAQATNATSPAPG